MLAEAHHARIAYVDVGDQQDQPPPPDDARLRWPLDMPNVAGSIADTLRIVAAQAVIADGDQGVDAARSLRVV